jgi:hypothetical protein
LGSKTLYIRLNGNTRMNSQDHLVVRMIGGNSAIHGRRQTPDTRTITPGGPIGILCNILMVSGKPIGVK